jgi:hypothetical protein
MGCVLGLVLGLRGSTRSTEGVSTWHERRHASHRKGAGVLGVVTSNVDKTLYLREKCKWYQNNARSLQRLCNASI